MGTIPHNQASRIYALLSYPGPKPSVEGVRLNKQLQRMRTCQWVFHDKVAAVDEGPQGFEVAVPQRVMGVRVNLKGCDRSLRTVHKSNGQICRLRSFSRAHGSSFRRQLTPLLPVGGEVRR